MFYYILGVALLITALLPALLLLFGHADKTVCAAALTATTVLGGLMLLAGWGLRSEAKKTYNELLQQKAFIEQNYNSDDLFTEIKVHDTYFQYMFKYQQVVEDGSTSIISPYYGFDIEALKLNIK